jgi:hypothetical protein
MSKNKAVTFDGFSDNWFKETKSVELLRNWWNPQTIKMLMPLSMEARLIPLNKVYPNLPEIEQFRPITVLSSAIKWIESRFKDKLQDYINKHIDKD